MVTQEAIEKAMNSKKITAASVEDNEYAEKIVRAAACQELPEWVRRAANRMISLAERKGVAVDAISFEDVGIGLHDNIVESAILGDEGQRFFLIVMNFEDAIKNMRGF